jgi:hypothetical protein
LDRPLVAGLCAPLRQTRAVLDGRRLEVWSRISTRVDELVRLLERVDPVTWERRTSAEGWTVGLVGCHISLGLRRQAHWIELAVKERAPHAFDWERTHALNALVARRVIQPNVAEVLAALRAGLERWRKLLERMREDDLDRIGFRSGGTEKTVGWVAGVLAPRHIDEHLRSIREAIAS